MRGAGVVVSRQPVVSAATSSGASAGNAGAAAVAVAPSVGSGAAVTAAPSVGVAPVAAAKAAPAVPQWIQKIDAQNQALVRTVFHALLNWTSTLPVNSVTTWLEGGLLMIRKSLFNQTAGVHSVQTANSPTLVTGKINVIDPEGDGWKVELVGDASHGTVTLGATSQADGIGSTKYTYTPGTGYTGDDQFVVKVTPTQKVFNIYHPFGVLDTRYYTVTVGNAAEAAKDRFNLESADPKDVLDTHLYLENTAATVTVKKQGFLTPTYNVTVQLAAGTAAKSFAWMDTRGNMGSIPVDTMLTEDWGAYSKKAAENGVKPLLTFKYSDQGVDKAVFVDVGSVVKNADGSYTLTGDLKDGVPAQDGRVDTWDFTGNKYKVAFDNFLESSGLKDCKSGQACTTVSTVGILGATTLSPSAFVETGGHDYPQPAPDPQNASALQTSPGSMGPGTTQVGAGNGTEVFGNTGYQTLELSSMIPWGTDGSFIAASNLTQVAGDGNGIFLYTAQTPRGGEPKWTKTQLIGNSWNAAVNVMAEYDQVLTDSTGTPITTTYTGTTVGGLTAVNAVTLALPTGVNPTSLLLQPISGTGIPAGTIINGVVSSDIKGVTFSTSMPIDPATKAIAVTLPNEVTTQPGMVVGLSDGSVYYWNGNVCSSSDSSCKLGGSTGAAIIPTGSASVIQNVDSPVSLAYAPNGNVYALGDNLTVIDSKTNTIITTLGLARPGPVPQVVVSPDGAYAYATVYLGNDTAGLAVVDTAKNVVLTNLYLPQYTNADAVAISPDSTYGYIASGSTGSVYRFTTSSDPVNNPPVLGTVTALPGALPDPGYAGLAFSPDGSTLYVSYAQNGTVYVMDTSTDAVTQTIGVGGSPGALAVSPDGKSLIVTQSPNFGANFVSVIDTSTSAVSQVIVGNGPAGVAFNPNPGQPFAYVTNSNDSTVSVINTATMDVVGTFATGAGDDDTLGIAISPDGLYAYLGNYNGGGNDYGTVPVFQIATPVAQGWAQLQSSGGWGDGVAVNTVTPLLNNKGVAIGLSNGAVATWNTPILADGTIVSSDPGCSNGSPGGCWTVTTGPMNSVNAIMSSGQDGGFVAIGTAYYNGANVGWLQGFNGALFPEGAPFDASNPTTLLPYDGTTLVGSIGSTPLIAEDLTTTDANGQQIVLNNAAIAPPSYASSLPGLSAATSGCTWSYNSGPGTGCGGYVLTVQQAGGSPIRIGQKLYGGPGLAAGTTITEQISDGEGNLCAQACNGGGTGVYLVDTSQTVAPGTPMSASDGTGFIVGFSNGAVSGWNNELNQLVSGQTWYSPVNTMIPWRDGLVLGLDNGSIMYWSPSNNPEQGSAYVPPGNGPALALDYVGSTIESTLAQPPGWSQLQGYDPSCGCFPAGTQAATSMVQMGDGFAVGFTQQDGSNNGVIELFMSFGALAANSAFGYEQITSQTTSGSGQPTTTTTVLPVPPINAFFPVATGQGSGSLPEQPGAVGSVQQLIPISQFTKNSAGNAWNASSLVVGLTDNGIYSWTGSTLFPTPTGTAWNQLQAPAPVAGALDPETLATAWAFGGQADQKKKFGTKNAVGETYTSTTTADGTTTSGDPLFGQTINQAWCGDTKSCASQGDYKTFVYSHAFGDDGVIYSFGDTLQADLNLSALGYGYLFVPNGVWDKFKPDDYSAGVVMAVQGGPSAILKLPATSLTVSDTWTGSTQYTDQQETEFGVFGETIGIKASLTGELNLAIPAPNPLKLAYAYYTPGLMFTWNTAGNSGSLGMTYSAYPSTGYINPSTLASYFAPTGTASVSATVTPYATLSYGLFTDDLDIFKLSVGYQNPITADLTIPLNNPGNSTLSLTSQGFLTASAAFIPGITSDLTWKGKYQVYSVKDQLQPPSFL